MADLGEALGRPPSSHHRDLNSSVVDCCQLLIVGFLLPTTFTASPQAFSVNAFC